MGGGILRAAAHDDHVPLWRSPCLAVGAAAGLPDVVLCTAHRRRAYIVPESYGNVHNM